MLRNQCLSRITLVKGIRKSMDHPINSIRLMVHGRNMSASKCGGCDSDKSENMSRDTLGQKGVGDNVIPSLISGLDRLSTKGLNKGLGFTIEERQVAGIHGLLPPIVKTPEQQVEHCKQCMARIKDPLDTYMYLMHLMDTNEKLFYKFVQENVYEIMPFIYTPVVGLACQNFSLIYPQFTKPRGLYITLYDKGHVYDIIKSWIHPDVRVIVVTDGERILGLGDLGANGMPIPIGKLALYVGLAGIKPHHCLPIVIDVGTNNKKFLEDPHYIGLRQKRVTGPAYFELIEEFMEAVVRRYGQNCLIQFEDFGNAHAFVLLEKYRNFYCTFNDDIQGTASVAVAGLFASLRITKKKMSDNVIVFQGAGEANLGIANLCVMAMMAEGTSEKDAIKKIWMVDSKGLLAKGRPEGGISAHKERFVQEHAPIKNLVDVVKTMKPTMLIGAAAVGGAFTEEILKEMAKNNERPVIFALSNPTQKAECTPEQAYKATNGKCVFATGSPFDPVTHNGKTYHVGQGNNAYVFPGVGLGVICSGVQHVDEEVFLIAAETLANLVTDEDLDSGMVYPPLKKVVDCSVKIALRIMEYSYEKGKATLYPEPCDKEGFIRAQMYNTCYDPVVPAVYSVPPKCGAD